METDLFSSIASIVVGLLAIVGALQYFAKWTETDKDNKALDKIHAFLLKIKGLFFANQKAETQSMQAKDSKHNQKRL